MFERKTEVDFFYSEHDVIIDFFIKKINYIIKALQNRPLGFTVIDEKIAMLESMIYIFDEKNKTYSSIMSSLGPTKRNLLNTLYSEWETELEKVFFTSVLNNTAMTISDYKLTQRFIRLIENEIKLLAQQSHQLRRLLFIGSGSMPISVILLKKMLNVEIDCLDIDPEAVYNSQNLLEKWNITGITVYNHTIEQHDATHYDAIFVALLAKPKDSILRALYRSTRENCPVICRTSTGLRTLLYEPTSLTFLDKYRIEKKYIAKHTHDIISSLLLSKKDLPC